MDKAVEQACDRVLTAFHRKPQMCLHVLEEATELSRRVLRQAVVVLQQRKKLRKADHPEGGIYELVDKSNVPEFSSNRLPELFGLDESTARARATLLKKFRDRLHCELHPVLNLVINDYERGLRVLEAIREGEPDDE